MCTSTIRHSWILIVLVKVNPKPQCWNKYVCFLKRLTHVCWQTQWLWCEIKPQDLYWFILNHWKLPILFIAPFVLMRRPFIVKPLYRLLFYTQSFYFHHNLFSSVDIACCYGQQSLVSKHVVFHCHTTFWPLPSGVCSLNFSGTRSV